MSHNDNRAHRLGLMETQALLNTESSRTIDTHDTPSYTFFTNSVEAYKPDVLFLETSEAPVNEIAISSEEEFLLIEVGDYWFFCTREFHILKTKSPSNKSIIYSAIHLSPHPNH